MTMPQADTDITHGEEIAPDCELPAEELAGLRQAVWESFREAAPYLPMIPIRRRTGLGRELTLQPMLPIAVLWHEELKTVESPFVPAATVINTVAEYFGFTPAEVRSHKRQPSLVRVRQIAMYLMRERTPLSFNQIATEFDGRDHSTVIHSVAKIRDQLEESANLPRDVEALTALLQDPQLRMLGERMVEMEDLVVVAEEGLFACPTFIMKGGVQKLVAGEYGVGMEWDERVSDDALWFNYGKAAQQQLAALARRGSQ
jgi:hypothetical protein